MGSISTARTMPLATNPVLYDPCARFPHSCQNEGAAAVSEIRPLTPALNVWLKRLDEKKLDDEHQFEGDICFRHRLPKVRMNCVDLKIGSFHGHVSTQKAA